MSHACSPAKRSHTVYAKSFIAISTTGRLTSARSALSVPHHVYTCHLCGCPVELHDAGTGRSPWFEHIEQPISTHRRNDCPYLNPEQEEIDRVMTLRRLVPGALPLVRKADWHCTKCTANYHGEKYCKPCQTGIHSIKTSKNGF
ncbi:putative zinc ribbon protein [Yersinia enterocolitica]|uniref:putative zinc ribbon protein n=1 Tax=Yersinia enterocolitica TaxID=630 RepID=UPI003D032A73